MHLWSACTACHLDCSSQICALQVLNYGQGLFEGMKAQRTPQGKIVLFRPEENAARLQAGAASSQIAPAVLWHSGTCSS